MEVRRYAKQQLEGIRRKGTYMTGLYDNETKSEFIRCLGCGCYKQKADYHKSWWSATGFTRYCKPCDKTNRKRTRVKPDLEDKEPTITDSYTYSWDR